jgi:hypothetical protein
VLFRRKGKEDTLVQGEIAALFRFYDTICESRSSHDRDLSTSHDLVLLLLEGEFRFSSFQPECMGFDAIMTDHTNNQY